MEHFINNVKIEPKAYSAEQFISGVLDAADKLKKKAGSGYGEISILMIPAGESGILVSQDELTEMIAPLKYKFRRGNLVIYRDEPVKIYAQ